MKKLVFISDIATPQQIKFCNALQQYFQAIFWFYESPDRTRGSWWNIKINENIRIIKDTWFARKGFLEFRYYSPSLVNRLNEENPDILVLGGFSRPSNYLAYRWAVRNNKKIVVITERSRDASGNLRSRGFIWLFIKLIYKGVNLILVTAEDIIPQFRDQFGFGNKVYYCPYAADIDEYLKHSERVSKINAGYTYLFANRLTKIYNPIDAIKIFKLIHDSYPMSVMKMNASGELRNECEEIIRKNHLENSIQFLDEIKKWEDLHKIYKQSDILLFPAIFSNGNFTILEAMASGMGIIISQKIMGVGNLIKNGTNGFVCSDENREYFNAIESYILNPDLFSKHAKINREIVKSYTPEYVAKKFNEILKKITF